MAGKWAKGETPPQFEAHKWKKGQSGNPNGGPRTNVTAELRRLLLTVDRTTKKTLLEELAKGWIKYARKGRFPYFKELLDRTEGKVAEKHEIGGLNGEDISITTNAIRQRIASRLARRGSSE